MSVYTTAKCGHCGEKWTRLNPNVPWGIFGPPVIRCIKCNKDNKTRHKLPRDVNPIIKVLISAIKGFFGLLVSLIILCVGPAIGMGVYSEYGSNFIYVSGDPSKGINYVFTVMILLFVIGPVIYGIKGVINTLKFKSDMLIVERKFDENGGFLWSNEAYDYTYL
jgi:hypothetical protein